jgi:hypothetical protein
MAQPRTIIQIKEKAYRRLEGKPLTGIGIGGPCDPGIVEQDTQTQSP